MAVRLAMSGETPALGGDIHVVGQGEQADRATRVLDELHDSRRRGGAGLDCEQFETNAWRPGRTTGYACHLSGRACSPGDSCVAAHVGERGRGGLQVDLEGVEQHSEHGEVAQAADEVDDALLAQFVQGRGEGGVRDEVLAQDLGAELVDHFLVAAGEARLFVLRQRLQALRGHAGLDGLADVRVPRVLRIPVPRGDEQAQLAKPQIE